MNAADAADLATEADELREAIARLRLEAADLADKLSQMAHSIASIDAFMNVVIAARHKGYREGSGEHDTYQAATLARQRRAKLRAVPGRTAARKGKSGGTQ